MKKNYIAPSMKITIVALQKMIATSGFSTNLNGFGGYGGVDTDGTQEAASRNSGLWDDDDDF